MLNETNWSKTHCPDITAQFVLCPTCQFPFQSLLHLKILKGIITNNPLKPCQFPRSLVMTLIWFLIPNVNQRKWEIIVSDAILSLFYSRVISYQEQNKISIFIKITLNSTFVSYCISASSSSKVVLVARLGRTSAWLSAAYRRMY